AARAGPVLQEPFLARIDHRRDAVLVDELHRAGLPDGAARVGDEGGVRLGGVVQIAHLLAHPAVVVGVALHRLALAASIEVPAGQRLADARVVARREGPITAGRAGHGTAPRASHAARAVSAHDRRRIGAGPRGAGGPARARRIAVLVGRADHAPARVHFHAVAADVEVT